MSDFNEIEFSPQIFPKYTNIKLHENSSSGILVVPCGQTDVRTEMAKLAVDFKIFRKRLKNEPRVCD